MDRVVVAGHGGVPPAEVPGEPPLHAAGRHVLEGAVRGGRVAVTAADAEQGGGGLPDQLAAAVHVDDDVEDPALGVRAQARGTGGHLHRLVRGDRTVLGDGVLEVHRADGGERKRPVGHDRHVQRERQHVRVGQRQVVLEREPADLAVRRHVVAVDRHVVPRLDELGHAGPGLADARELVDDRDRRQRRLEHGRDRHRLRPPASSGRRPAPRCR